MPACTGGLLERKTQIGARIEDTCGTAETLALGDFKARVIADSSVEYDAPREARDIAQASLSPTGTLESTKAVNITLNSELNTPDSMALSGLTDEDVDTIDWQSGNIIRYTLASTPDLSGVEIGDYLFVHSATNASNNGTFVVTGFDDTGDYIDVINRGRSDSTDDEASDSPAVCDVLNPIEYAAEIEACSQDIKAVRKISVGSITGTYARNETITGGTSTATGRVLVAASGSDGLVYYQLLTGLFQTGEVITGAASGSATSSSGPSTVGYAVTPKSSNQEACTIRREVDGFQWTARSAMGEMGVTFEANKRAMIAFAMRGPKSSTGDQALTASVVQYSEQPPILKTAAIAIGAVSPVVNGMTFAQNNEISLRQNANATGDSGFETARITGRRPTLTINMEFELAATFDLYTIYDAGTDQALSFKQGSVEGKTVYFYADEAEISAPPLSNNEGVLTTDLEFLLKGTGNNVDREYEWLFI